MGEGWRESALANVASVNPTDPPLPADAPFVPMDAVQPGLRWPTYFTSRGERGGARARAGDTLFARITPCLENGKVAQVQQNVERCGGSTEFIVLRAGSQLLPDFLYVWATASSTRLAAAALMTGTTGRQRLSPQDMAALPITVLPLAEQRRIVDLVAALDATLSTSIAVSVEIHRTLAALREHAVAEAAEFVSLDELLTSIDAGRSPDAMERMPLPGERLVLKVNAVRPGRFDGTAVKVLTPEVEMPPGSLLHEGDLLMTRANGNRDLVGTACLAENVSPRCYLSDKTLRLTPRRDAASGEYLMEMLLSRQAREQILEMATGTASMKNITQASIRKIQVPALSLPRQHELTLAMRCLRDLEATVRAESAALADLRAGAVSELLSGDHEIPASYDRFLVGAA